MAKPDDIRPRWQKELNLSTIILAEQLCKAENRYKHSNRIVGYLGILAIMSTLILCYRTGFDISLWFNSANRILLFVTGIIILFTYMYAAHQKQAKEEKEKFSSLVIKRVDADFCKCLERCPMNHKEKFLEYMKKEQGINLYYF